MKSIAKKSLPHLVAIITFFVATNLYFLPLHQGKGLSQHDIEQFKGSAQEIIEHREQFGEEPLWTNTMFAGMPAYLISTKFSGNLLVKVDKVLQMSKRPAGFIFFALVGFYILLLVLKVNPWLSIVGAFAYALSSYFFIVIAAGHNAKMHAISYVAPMIAGIILAFRGKYIGGFALFALFLGLNLNAGHVQITYYAGFIILALGIAFLIDAIKEKTYNKFLKAVGVLALAGVLAVGANFSRLYFTWESGKYSIRGASELSSNDEDRTSGLDKEYATAWSYGKTETFNLLIPNLMGGSSAADFGTNSNTYDFLIKNRVPPAQAKAIVAQLPAYWGPQPMTSGPVYIGAIVIFLFVLGMFILKGPMKWALFGVTLLGIMLAWGHNFLLGDFLKYSFIVSGFALLVDFYIKRSNSQLSKVFVKEIVVVSIGVVFIILGIFIGKIFSEEFYNHPFTYIFLDFFPGYNKFRTVSMILYIAEFTIPLLGILALKEIYQESITKERFIYGLKWAVGITAGLCIFFIVFGSALFHFDAEIDYRYIESGYPAEMFEAVRMDRKAMLRTDAFRSLIFILLGASVLLGYFFKKLKPFHFIGLLMVLIIADMWTVNRRYLNNDNFVPQSKSEKPFVPTNADRQILADNTKYFRVYNLTVSPFNDASTSYFHKSLGGYHGAKLRRYQELIDYHITRGNMAVLNMLNTRYIIEQSQQGPVASFNPNALGNAWFVDSVEVVENADAEIAALNAFNPKTTAIVDKRFLEGVESYSSSPSVTDTIFLSDYRANRLAYKYNLENPRLAVFSEIHYPVGWVAKVNNEELEHIRVNYLLRAVLLPAGENEVVFEYKPKMFEVGHKVDLASSILILLLVIGWIGNGLFKAWFSEN
ncbi:MAG: hypothetical protein CVT98_03605 [Bacteroidetes bacterium HGW-Bacteroidetes-15]|nr:MAG: hypothetical protein CVT98_03605 [Bacteroidetes bacterium HGW-Bacteroidetes-15]